MILGDIVLGKGLSYKLQLPWKCQAAPQTCLPRQESICNQLVRGSDSLMNVNTDTVPSKPSLHTWNPRSRGHLPTPSTLGAT